MSELNSSPTHRHDNRTELEKLLVKGKPWFEENGTLLIYGLAAILGIAAVFVFLGRRPSGDLEASRALLLAVSPEDYRDVADAHPETPIGQWARLRQADRLLDNAVGNMFTNREVALEELDQAETAYQRLADQTGLDSEIHERVLIGLARLAETRCDGTSETTQTAVTAWEELLTEFPESFLKEHAESRVKALQTEQAKSFYAWFSAQNPAPADPGLAPGQTAVPEIPPGAATENSSDAAETDDKTPDGEKPGEEGAADTTKEASGTPAAADAPTENQTPPADSPPADSPSPPAETEPAAKPAEDRESPKAAEPPAETKPPAEPAKPEPGDQPTPAPADAPEPASSEPPAPEPEPEPEGSDGDTPK